MPDPMDISLLPKVQLLDINGRNILDGVQVSNTPELELRVVLVDLTTGDALTSI